MLWAGVAIGALAGVLVTLIGLAAWTAHIAREERLEAQARAGCQPEWCPLMIDTEREARDALRASSSPCCDGVTRWHEK